MPAPFPYEAVAGTATDAAETEAFNLYRNYSWVARLVNEMSTDAQFNRKRASQLADHLAVVRRWHEALQSRVGTTHTAAQIADVIEGIFAAKKCRWATRTAMNTDLQAIYAASGAMIEWIEPIVAGYSDGVSVNRRLSPGVYTDDAIVDSVQPAGAASRLSDFRALFAANTMAVLKKG